MTKIEEVLKRLDETIETNSKLRVNLSGLKGAIEGLSAPDAPPAPPAPPPAPPAPPAQLIMTAAANGMTYDQYKAANWTDEQMITGGVATAAPPAAPPADSITPEELNTIMVAEFNRLGDRAPIDGELKKLGVTGVSELPVEKYQELIDNVKALVKVA